MLVMRISAHHARSLSNPKASDKARAVLRSINWRRHATHQVFQPLRDSWQERD